MSRRTTCLLILAALTISLGVVSSASAGPYLGHGGYGAYHSTYSREYIPYFAQHPPVYYSYPVPRPYGWSPYAYPPGVMTPEAKIVTPIQPATITNPYVDQPSEADSADDKTARTQPLVIENPYYLASDRPIGATKAVAKTATRGPLRVANPHYRD